MSKTALVLEGGGLRGVFTGGVIDCFLDKNIEFDYVVGVSAGACNTFSYLAKKRGYVRCCMIQTDPFNSFMGLPQMVGSHKVVDLDKIFYEYTELYGFDFNKFVETDIPWEMVISNIETGLPEYKHTTDADKARLIGKASCSIPGITAPVEIDGNYYLDGGICDSIPVQRALDLGYDKMVVVLTRKRGNYSIFNKPTLDFLRRRYAEYPEFVKALEHRGQLYQDEVALAEQLEAEGKAIIIRPTYQEVSRFESDEKELNLFYYHGYTKAKEYIDRINALKE